MGILWMVDGVFCRDPALGRHLEERALARANQELYENEQAGNRSPISSPSSPSDTAAGLPVNPTQAAPVSTASGEYAHGIPIPPPNSEVAAQPRAPLEHRAGTTNDNWEPVTAIEKSAGVHQRFDTLDSSTATVKDLMTRQVVAVSSATPVSEALDLFEGQEFQHLPVVNEEQALIGLVSDRDLLGREGQLGEFMASKVLTASPDTSLEQAAQALAKQRFHSLVVIDESRRPIGMLTSSDLLEFLVSHPAMRLWRR
ncbi:MAG: CBS domain-containing protein [Candidatus Eremiobacteraeota bacterium]|nr:CBS domain-containing protein [Candidatus Eremiobacteraeota bacterium]